MRDVLYNPPITREPPQHSTHHNANLALDERLRRRVVDGDQSSLEDLLDQAIAERTADPAVGHSAAALSLITAVLQPAMSEVISRFAAGAMILPFVLQGAEVMHRALSYLEERYLTSDSTDRKGSIVVATVPGDVHDMARALLVAILSTNGYTVHDLGKQVPIEKVVDAAVELNVDAIGLSALLVSTSLQMPRCIAELDRRGVRVPVLIGGAAINRAFGRRAALLPDGRIYEPAVFYCKDVFEGLATMDALTDPSRQADVIAEARREIAAERDQKLSTSIDTARLNPRAAPSPRRDVVIPRPAAWGASRLSVDLRDVWRYLDHGTLFRYHWGGYRANVDDYERLVREVFEPRLELLMEEALTAGWLEPLIVSGVFPANAAGDALIVFDPIDHTRELTRLIFPRQPDGDHLCLSDYFQPLSSGLRDVVVLQAVSSGARVGAYIDQLQRSGEYARTLYVNGLASATAEALAEYAHGRARHDLGMAADRGLRFSWGYAACPDLGEQRKVLPLVNAERDIGLSLSLSNNLDPEHSTAAIVVHHPEAKYFSVRPGV